MRRAARLAIPGLLGTVALLAVLRPDPEDPLTLTAALLPILVAGFAALHDPSVRRLPPGIVLGMLTALAGWGVLALRWRQLALPRAEPVVAAAGVLLLAGWLALELPGLLRRLAHARGGLAPPVFFLLPLMVYASVLPWLEARHDPSGDEPYYLLLAHSIAYDRDIDLANNYASDDAIAFMPAPMEPQDGDPTGEEGEMYSRHAPTLSALLALPYYLAGRTGAALIVLILASGVAWSGLALARELFPKRHRGQLLAWLTLAFGSPLAAYSYRFWAELPAALALSLASLMVLRQRAGSLPGGGRLLALVALLAWPILLKPRFVLVALPLGALAWWRSGRRWRPVVVGSAALLAILVSLLVLQLDPLDRLRGLYPRAALKLLDFPVSNWLRGAGGYLLDDAFGLAGAYPLWLLLLPALGVALRGGSAMRALLLVWTPYVLAFLPHLGTFSSFAPPFRYMLAALPVLAACLVPVLEDRRPLVRTITRALAGLTVLLTIVWTVQPEWTVNRVTGTNHLIDRLQLVTLSDFGRFFPSYLRVRPAAWIWGGVAVALAAGWRRWPARPALKGCAAALLLLATASIAWLADHAPTRTVELEDTWIEHHGGEEHPGPWAWTKQRSWKLRPGESVRIPVVPGGPRLRPIFRLGRTKGADPRVALELISDDGRLLRRWRGKLDGHLPRMEWRGLGPVEVPQGRRVRLTLRAYEPPPDPLHESRTKPAGPDEGTVVLDRARFVWSTEDP